MKLDRVINVLLYFLGMAFNLALMAVVGYAVWWAARSGHEWGERMAYDMVTIGPDYEVEFVLDEETCAIEVGRRLEEMGVVNNSLLFQAELFLMGRQSTYLAGTYTLNRNMTNTEVHQVMRQRPQDRAPHQVITIREGWTVRDMALYFEYREFFTAEEFINAVQYGPFNFPFIRDLPDRPGRLFRLEGYLFPETYHVSLNPTPGEIIGQMLRQFDRVFDDQMRDRAYELGRTIEEIVIIASIIEGEVSVPRERPIVSQVIYSRMAINMPLQMDSTVAYVHDVHLSRVLYVHLEQDSPFNTYTNRGLPVGAIGNPGEASLRAALWPSEDTTYIYFVKRDSATGEHFFAHTYAEHRAAVDRYRPYW